MQPAQAVGQVNRESSRVMANSIRELSEFTEQVEPLVNEGEASGNAAAGPVDTPEIMITLGEVSSEDFDSLVEPTVIVKLGQQAELDSSTPVETEGATDKWNGGDDEINAEDQGPFSDAVERAIREAVNTEPAGNLSRMIAELEQELNRTVGSSSQKAAVAEVVADPEWVAAEEAKGAETPSRDDSAEELLTGELNPPAVEEMTTAATESETITETGSPAPDDQPVESPRVAPTRADTCLPLDLEFDRQQYSQLISGMLERAGSLDSPTMLFTSTDSIPEASISVYRLAQELCGRQDVERVMLIDGRTGSRRLSRRLAPADHAGLAETINQDFDWRESVCPTPVTGLDFLPAGTGFFGYQKSSGQRIAALVKELRRDYQYILVDADDFDHILPKLWCPICDATFLWITLGKTEMTTARAAVAELHSYGARLLGCVVLESMS